MSERSLQHKESFITPILKQNPLFVSILGTCPALAVTKSLEASFGMGLLFTFVVCCSNVLISALRKLIPEEVRTPCYIVIIAAFVISVTYRQLSAPVSQPVLTGLCPLATGRRIQIPGK